ncbi:MAG: Secretion system C-terminal sorting domain [Bacteroidota bacterium]
MRQLFATLSLSAACALSAGAQCPTLFEPANISNVNRAPHFAIPVLSFTAPLTPTASSTANSISLTWPICKDAVGCSKSTCYVVQVAEKGGAFKTVDLVYRASATIRSLKPATDYKVRILAQPCDLKLYVAAQTGDDAVVAPNRPTTVNADFNANGIADAYIRTGSNTCGMASYEDNGTSVKATPISNGQTTYSVIQRATDVDYYKVEHSGGVFSVGLLNAAPGVTYSVLVENIFGNNQGIPFSSRNIVLGSFAGGKDVIGSGTLAKGTYYVKVFSTSSYNPMHCYALKTASSATSFEKVATEDVTARMDAFPNPANQLLTVNLPTVTEATTAIVTLSDIAGKAILKSETNLTDAASQIELDVNAVANGMYLIMVQYGTTTLTKKIVVAHDR